MNYIVIGAFDGVSFDDIFTKFHTEDRVIFVEPIPYYFKLLKLNALYLNCDCQFENTAISDKNEELEIAHVDFDHVNNYLNYYMGCSSVIENGKPINRYLQEVKQEHLKTIKINALTFDDLCAKYSLSKVDFVQVDCEGFDQRIVSSIDLEKYNIDILKFEIHYLDPNFIDDFAKKWPNYKYEIVEGDVIFTKL